MYRPTISSTFLPLSSENQILINQSGFYFCKFTTGTCTYYTDTLHVIKTTAVINIPEIPEICNSSPVQLKAEPEGGIWSGQGINDDGLLKPSLVENGSHTYSYNIHIENCSFTKHVEVDVHLDSLFVPNVITPNNDFKNEAFKVASKGIVDFSVYIYDRWGKELYFSNNPDFQWGKYDIHSGVYYWYIKYSSCEGSNERKGLVHVLN